MTDEIRAKISAANKGHIFSPESRAKMSAARIGNNNCLGRHLSSATKKKIGAAQIGRKASLETRAKLSVAHLGNIESSETRAKKSASEKGKIVSLKSRSRHSAAMMGRIGPLNSHWRGGKRISYAKTSAKRRTLGFVPLNKPFIGSDAHHVDRERVINLPKELHRSVYHRQDTGQGMAVMNAIAYNFLFKQEVEAVFAVLNAKAA